MENTKINSFSTLSKVQLALCRFLRNSCSVYNFSWKFRYRIS